MFSENAIKVTLTSLINEEAWINEWDGKFTLHAVGVGGHFQSVSKNQRLDGFFKFEK